MNNTSLVKFLLFFLVFEAASMTNALAQTELSPKKVNFGYSQNPKTKSTPENTENAPTENIVTAKNEAETNNIAKGSIAEITVAENQMPETGELENRPVVDETSGTTERAESSTSSPTEIYKIGIGDVLYISLQNAPAKASTYYTVLNDGKIDYALAGEMIAVNGLTTGEIENLLKEKIKLYENPQISVKIREHASHAITVLGTVEKAGEKYLQREAIPLFVVKAEAIVLPKTDTATIKRADSSTDKINLKDLKSDDVLIFPGDIIEFKIAEPSEISLNVPQFYFIGGNIASAGQKDFHQGLTLTQAVLASGGLKKPTIKKIILRRKNQNGLLSPFEFDLISIKNGKQPDPVLQAGDTIEVGK